VLIEKMPFHVLLNGVFLLLGIYVVLVEMPHAMWLFNVGLLLLDGSCLLIALLAWQVAKVYDAQRRWCRSFVPLTYAALAVLYASSFGVAAAGNGFLRGWGAFLLAVAGLGLLGVAFTVKPKLGRWLSSSVGGLSTAGGMMLAQAGGGHWFVLMVFCPLAAAACALLGVVAWRDGAV